MSNPGTGREGDVANDRRRHQRTGGPLPILFVVVLVVATSSFFHSVHELPHSSSSTTSMDGGGNALIGSSNSIHASLQNFKQPSIKTTTSKNKAAPKNVQPNTIAAANATTGNANDDATLVDRLREDPIPNPPLSNGTETFSACLLVMVRMMVLIFLPRVHRGYSIVLSHSSPLVTLNLRNVLVLRMTIIG